MGSSICITLPVPPPDVRPNGRPHWRVKAKHVKTMREAAWREVLGRYGDGPRWEHASVRIEWVHPTKRLLDRDNIIASCKAYIDGITDAGVVVDDVVLSYEPVVRCVAKRGELPRVEITITPLEQEPHNED